MQAFLAEPEFISSVVPLVVSFVLAGVAGLLLRRRALAGAAVPLAVLVVYWLALGAPPWPARASVQKIGWIVAAGLAIGLALDALSPGPRLRRAVVVVFALIAVAWIAEARLLQPTAAGLLPVAALAVGGAFAMDRLAAAGDARLGAPLMLLAAAIGLAILALLGASGVLAILAGATAAATGGYLLWNWPKPRFAFAGAAILGGGGGLVAIAAATVLFTRAETAAVALLVLVFLAAALAARLVARPAPVLGPVLVAAVAALPVLAALALTQFAGGQTARF